jgi:hypothetical protein
MQLQGSAQQGMNVSSIIPSLGKAQRAREISRQKELPHQPIHSRTRCKNVQHRGVEPCVCIHQLTHWVVIREVVAAPANKCGTNVHVESNSPSACSVHVLRRNLDAPQLSSRCQSLAKRFAQAMLEGRTNTVPCSTTRSVIRDSDCFFKLCAKHCK